MLPSESTKILSEKSTVLIAAISAALDEVKAAGGWKKWEAMMAEGKASKGPTGTSSMSVAEVRNRIVDAILKKFNLRPVDVNLDRLYGAATNTARKVIRDKQLTDDDVGQRKLETAIADILNMPTLEEKVNRMRK